MTKGCRLPAVAHNVFGERFVYEMKSSDYFWGACVSISNKPVNNGVLKNPLSLPFTMPPSPPGILEF